MDRPETDVHNGDHDAAMATPSHWLLLMLFLVTVAAAIVLLPVVKALTDAAVTRSTALHRMLKYKVRGGATEPTYDMGRIARRLMMVTAFALLIAYRKRLNIASLALTGLRPSPGWQSEVGLGLALGIGSLGLFMRDLVLLGAWRLEPTSESIAGVLFKSLGTGAAVGVLEEVLFRGFLLRSLTRSLGVRQGLVWSSAFYSVLHFFKAKVPAAVGFDPWIGLKTVGACFAPIAREPAVLADPSRWDESIIPGTIGLFLVGVVLGFAFVRTGRLWVSIGLHAGWVFVLKFQGLFIAPAGREMRWLYGGKDVVTGVLGWVLLLLLWWLLARLLDARGPADAPSGVD